MVRILSGKVTKSHADIMMRRDGKAPESKEENFAEWRSYFNGLLNNGMPTASFAQAAAPAASSHDLSANVEDFSITEVELAISRLKGGKAVGVDRSVTSESLRYGGRALANALQEYMQQGTSHM